MRKLSWIAPRIAAAAVLIALPFWYREPYSLHIIILILIWSFIYTSWSVMGRFGLVSLGHGGFMGIGAYVTALLWNYFHLTPWLGIPIAVLAAVAVALLIGTRVFDSASPAITLHCWPWRYGKRHLGFTSDGLRRRGRRAIRDSRSDH